MKLPSHFYNADEEKVLYDGSPLSWRISAYALIVEDDKLFVIKNRSEKLYDIPGGGIEIDESIEEALQRECREEAGIEVKAITLISTNEDYFYHTAQKRFYKTLQLFFSASISKKLPAPTKNTTEWTKWFSLSEVMELPLPQAVKKAISSKQFALLQ